MSENRKYKVLISAKARKMLGAHIKFLAQVNKEAAKKKKQQIMDSLSSLSTMPQRYPYLIDEDITKNKYRKLYVEKWYLVLYQIKDDTVVIDYILDCRQDYSWLIR